MHMVPVIKRNPPLARASLLSTAAALQLQVLSERVQPPLSPPHEALLCARMDASWFVGDTRIALAAIGANPLTSRVTCPPHSRAERYTFYEYSQVVFIGLFISATPFYLEWPILLTAFNEKQDLFSGMHTFRQVPIVLNIHVFGTALSPRQRSSWFQNKILPSHVLRVSIRNARIFICTGTDLHLLAYTL